MAIYVTSSEMEGELGSYIRGVASGAGQVALARSDTRAKILKQKLSHFLLAYEEKNQNVLKLLSHLW